MFVVSNFEAGQPKSLAEGKCVMAHFVKVGSRAELEDLEGGKLVEADGQRIAVFNIGGSYYAIESTCPHRGGPLAEGMVTGEEVICPWHGSRFNVKTGSVMTPPARQGVKSFPVRVTGDAVEIDHTLQSRQANPRRHLGCDSGHWRPCVVDLYAVRSDGLNHFRPVRVGGYEG